MGRDGYAGLQSGQHGAESGISQSLPFFHRYPGLPQNAPESANGYLPVPWDDSSIDSESGFPDEFDMTSTPADFNKPCRLQPPYDFPVG